MLLIPCPWCGPRAHVEFTYGGDAAAPLPAKAADDAAWYDALYLRDNPRGPHAELWHHSAGCRRWLKVRRDTLSHEVLAAAAPGEPLATDEP